MIDRIAAWLAAILFDASNVVEAWRLERRDRRAYGGEWIEGPVVCRACRHAFHSVAPHPEPGLSKLQCPKCFKCEAEGVSIEEWHAAKEAMN